VTMAKRLLEDGQRSIQEVSQAVGYEDVIFFRDLFKRHTGVCPMEYRTRFGTPPITNPVDRRGSRIEVPARTSW
jgi:AraC-like DNA-binding protein